MAMEKAVVVGSAGMLGGVMTKEVKETTNLGADLDKLTIATLFASGGKVELSIGGTKVGELEPKRGGGIAAAETKTIDLNEGAGIPTEGKDLEIELKVSPVMGDLSLRYAAATTVVGIKE